LKELLHQYHPKAEENIRIKNLFRLTQQMSSLSSVALLPALRRLSRDEKEKPVLDLMLH